VAFACQPINETKSQGQSPAHAQDVAPVWTKTILRLKHMAEFDKQGLQYITADILMVTDLLSWLKALT
jgi:hypothetical protein